MLKSLLFLLLLSEPPLIFQWVATDGVIHITDNIEQIPEPYYQIYEQQIKEAEERAKKTNNAPANTHNTSYNYQPAYTPATNTNQQNSQKAQWQQKVKFQQNRLLQLTKKFGDLEEQAGAIRNLGEMAFIPQNRARLAELEEQKTRTLQEIEQTKHILNIELPEEARKAGIPPGWLR